MNKFYKFMLVKSCKNLVKYNIKTSSLKIRAKGNESVDDMMELLAETLFAWLIVRVSYWFKRI